MVADISTERTKNYFAQIKGAVVYKAIAMLASFLAIPLMIHYLGKEQFGVWSTLLSVMSWIVFFDLGVGNGLRNKVAESLAKNHHVEAAGYVASGYTLIGMISLIILCFFLIGSFFIPWQTVFNTRLISESSLRLTMQIAVLFIVLNFWLGLIGSLLGAIQKTSISALGQLISNVLALAIVYCLTKTTSASIVYLAVSYGFSLVAANIIISLWFYKAYPELRPEISLDMQHVRPLLSVGIQFFSIQIASLIIFTTDKMMITQLFGPQYIAQYEVVFKLFSVITFVHALISAPLWSAYTDAYHRDDFLWIKKMLRKQLYLFAAAVVSVLVLVFLSSYIIKLWIGSTFLVSEPLVLSMGLFVVVSIWNNVFGYILGGINKIRLGAYYTILTAILNIPISYLFAIKLEIGLAGIILGTVCSIFISAIFSPLQVYYFIFTKQNSRFLSGLLK